MGRLLVEHALEGVSEGGLRFDMDPKFPCFDDHTHGKATHASVEQPWLNSVDAIHLVASDRVAKLDPVIRWGFGRTDHRSPKVVWL